MLATDQAGLSLGQDHNKQYKVKRKAVSQPC